MSYPSPPFRRPTRVKLAEAFRRMEASEVDIRRTVDPPVQVLLYHVAGAKLSRAQLIELACGILLMSESPQLLRALRQTLSISRSWWAAGQCRAGCTCRACEILRATEDR